MRKFVHASAFFTSLGLIKVLIFTYLVLGVLLISGLYFSSFVSPELVIVPHDNAAADFRSQFFRQFSQSQPQITNIILLSPSHFSPDQSHIFYSDRDWHTSRGLIKSGSNLFSSDLLVKNSYWVANDHGIYNLFPDIHQYFPHADFFPILIGNRVSVSDLDTLSTLISQSCLSRCLVIASVDFSHYLPEPVAYLHDIYSYSALASSNSSKILLSEVDSPQTLYVINKISQNRHLHLHLTRRDYRGTTSHFFASYSRLPSAPLPPVTTSILSSSLPVTLDPDALSRLTMGSDLVDFTDANIPNYQLILGLQIGQDKYKYSISLP